MYIDWPTGAGENCTLVICTCPPVGCEGTAAELGPAVPRGERGIHIVEYGEAALRDVAGHVVTLAGVEDQPAHGQAVTARFRP